MIEYGSPDGIRWDLRHDEAHFSVRNNGTRINCRVTQEALEDNCGDPQTAEACLDAAKEYFDPITDIAGYLITNQCFETDGSILVRSTDWK